MKILHVTDLHFHPKWLAWLAENADRFDACCVSGDWINRYDTCKINPRKQAKEINAFIGAFPGKLFTCTGEHDWWPQNRRNTDLDAEGQWLQRARRPGVTVDGMTEEFNGYTFICSPWARYPETRKTSPILAVVHAPPEGTPLAIGLGHEIGDANVLEAAKLLPRGSLLLSGHVHDPSRWCAQVGDVWCFNPGVAKVSAAVPNHIEIDTKAKTATYFARGKALSPMKIV